MGNVSADQSGRLLNKISLTTEDRFVKRYQFAKFQKKTMIIAKVMIYKNCWALGIGPHHDEQQFFRFIFENGVSNKSDPVIHLKKQRLLYFHLTQHQKRQRNLGAIQNILKLFNHECTNTKYFKTF